jgi:hypothetical protein
MLNHQVRIALSCLYLSAGLFLGACKTNELNRAPNIVIEPHSNVEIAREYWCEHKTQGFTDEQGETDVLARIDAVRCAGNTNPGGCESGVSREEVDQLLRQASEDWEQHVYSCKPDSK